MTSENTAPDRPERPHESRSRQALDTSPLARNPELGHEIGDVRDLLGRLQSFAESGFFSEQTAPSRSQGAAGRLGDLADPRQFNGPLDLGVWRAQETHGFLRDMLLIRAVEERLATMVEAGDVACPVHLAVGQEATPVGVSHWLSPDDRVFGAHRSHGHYLALGGNVYQLFAEVLGRMDGCSHGMGGSMHLYSPEVGFHGSVPIVAATVPVAVGAALAAKMDGRGGVSVAYFGDGAVEEGVVHESMNMASQMGLPVLFVCENNLYASHMDIAQRQPSDRTARFAESHAIETAVIDGNDVLAVANAAGELIHRARCGDGPGYLEAVTYRWRGHVGPDENIDVGLRRSEEELAAWKGRDPVGRLKQALAGAGALTDDAFAAMVEETAARIETAATRAYLAPYPPAAALLDCVFSGTRG